MATGFSSRFFIALILVVDVVQVVVVATNRRGIQKNDSGAGAELSHSFETDSSGKLRSGNASEKDESNRPLVRQKRIKRDGGGGMHVVTADVGLYQANNQSSNRQHAVKSVPAAVSDVHASSKTDPRRKTTSMAKSKTGATTGLGADAKEKSRKKNATGASGERAAGKSRKPRPVRVPPNRRRPASSRLRPKNRKAATSTRNDARLHAVVVKRRQQTPALKSRTAMDDMTSSQRRPRTQSHVGSHQTSSGSAALAVAHHRPSSSLRRSHLAAAYGGSKPGRGIPARRRSKRRSLSSLTRVSRSDEKKQKKTATKRRERIVKRNAPSSPVDSSHHHHKPGEMNPLFDSRVVPIAARGLHRYQNNDHHAKTSPTSTNNNEIQKHLEAELKKAKKSRKKRELLAHRMSKMQKFFI